MSTTASGARRRQASGRRDRQPRDDARRVRARLAAQHDLQLEPDREREREQRVGGSVRSRASMTPKVARTGARRRPPEGYPGSSSAPTKDPRRRPMLTANQP